VPRRLRALHFSDEYLLLIRAAELDDAKRLESARAASS
jgi:hypothetical protein